jgi:hypothetical protein
LEDLSKNLGEGTDYFQVLVDIFKNTFRTEEQKHLRNFFIIGIPPLPSRPSFLPSSKSESNQLMLHLGG